MDRSTVIFVDTWILITLQDWLKEASVPKTRSTRPSVLIEHRLVTDRHRTTASTCAGISSHRWKHAIKFVFNVYRNYIIFFIVTVHMLCHCGVGSSHLSVSLSQHGPTAANLLMQVCGCGPCQQEILIDWCMGHSNTACSRRMWVCHVVNVQRM